MKKKIYIEEKKTCRGGSALRRERRREDERMVACTCAGCGEIFLVTESEYEENYRYGCSGKNK
jgi:hypothetical protein